MIKLAIDCEFTHFDMIGGDLLSLAAVEVIDDKELGREFHAYCKPRSTKYFSDKAQEVHGISYFKAQTFPEPRESMIAFLQWLYPLKDQFQLETIYWGSWNFDLKWIENTMTQTELVSSFYKAFKTQKESHHNALAMARKKLKLMPMPKAKTEAESKKGQYKLDNVARFYGLEHTHHEALSDARVTAQAYIKMMAGEKVWTGELF